MYVTFLATTALLALIAGALTAENPVVNPPEPEENATTVLFAFENDATDWQIVDDGVMGGRSRGAWLVENSVGIFQGTLSLENNGGFSSVRSRPLDQDCQAAQAFRIRVRGDGRTYQFRARTSANMDGVSYRAEFATQAGEWQIIELPFDHFEASFRGRILTDQPNLAGEDLITVGFLLADNNPGSFRLEVDWVGVLLPKSKEERV